MDCLIFKILFPIAQICKNISSFLVSSSQVSSWNGAHLSWVTKLTLRLQYYKGPYSSEIRIDKHNFLNSYWIFKYFHLCDHETEHYIRNLQSIYRASTLGKKKCSWFYKISIQCPYQRLSNLPGWLFPECFIISTQRYSNIFHPKIHKQEILARPN